MPRKSPAQLDREIAEALAPSPHSARVHARARSTKLSWKKEPGSAVQAPISHGGSAHDYVISHRRDQHTVSYRPPGQHQHVGSYTTERAAKAAAAQHAATGNAPPGDTPSAKAWTPRAHARKKKKITHQEAKQLLKSEGVDFSRDSDELSLSTKNRIAEVAKLAGYRKSKNAPGSTARMYFQYLGRLKHHATRGKHTVYDLIEANTRTKKERVLHEHFSTREHAKEAQDEYKALKKPDVTYTIRSRQVTRPPLRWNPED